MLKKEETHTAVIGIGSNIRPEKYIPEAVTLIRKSHRLLAESRFVQTEPLGFQDQDDFINGAVKIKTYMNFRELNDWLKDTEHRLGRIRTKNKNGPRTIDLDIVVWDGSVVDALVWEREFLKNAVFEVEPSLIS